MENIIKKLRQGGNVRRIVTYCDTKVMQHFQLNKKEKYVCWELYHLPTNKDKSRAVLQNSFLPLKGVISIINKTKQ
jgi:hypothetical protein